ncbi:MAG: tRNA-dihydrouridine synthase family protein [Chlorobi bacterium]|nr:tRNA-dihydrouridine synthase family protein [Chlorobiota bacterium]
MLNTTDHVFRKLCRHYGAALTFTEMASSSMIASGSTQAARYAAISRQEHPVGIQLFVDNMARLEEAIEEINPLQPDVIDINAGCPSDKVCSHGAGAALLANLPELQEIIKAVKRYSHAPVSVKVRVADRHSRIPVRDIARAVEDAGASFLTVHARTRYDRYEEPARWEWIAEAVRAVNIPVIGNGDVFTSDDARRMMRETGCHAVMVARGALGTPWIFAGKEDALLDASAVRSILLQLVRELDACYGPIVALPRASKHVAWFTRFFEGAEQLRVDVFRCRSMPALISTVNRYFDTNPARLDPGSEELKAVEDAFHRRILFWAEMDTEDVVG